MREALLSLVIIGSFAGLAQAQDTPTRIDLNSPTFFRDVNKTDDFNQLSEAREDLTKLISDTQNEIASLTESFNRLPDVGEAQRFLRAKEAELAEAKKAATANPDLIDALTHIATRTRDDLKKKDDLRIELKNAKEKLGELTKKRSHVEQRIAFLLRAAKETGTFRWVTSVSFCLLVMVVILGFYLIAFKKEKIAYTIFSGEQGMQFITLFLIVIAIILFGIMGTLEGKELAALLGGLSGYILGRTSRQITGNENGEGNQQSGGQQAQAGGVGAPAPIPG